VAEFQLDDAVLNRARRVGADELQSLGTIHSASAIAVGADAVVTYDKLLAESAMSSGLGVLSPTS